MIQEDDVKRINFDYWSNAKRDIVLVLWDLKPVGADSISDLARRVKKSFSVTYKHVQELQELGVLLIDSKKKVRLLATKLSIDEIFKF